MWQGVSDGSGYLGYNFSIMKTYFINKNGNVSDLCTFLLLRKSWNELIVFH